MRKTIIAMVLMAVPSLIFSDEALPNPECRRPGLYSVSCDQPQVQGVLVDSEFDISVNLGEGFKFIVKDQSGSENSKKAAGTGAYKLSCNAVAWIDRDGRLHKYEVGGEDRALGHVSNQDNYTMNNQTGIVIWHPDDASNSLHKDNVSLSHNAPFYKIAEQTGDVVWEEQDNKIYIYSAAQQRSIPLGQTNILGSNAFTISPAGCVCYKDSHNKPTYYPPNAASDDNCRWE